MSVKNKPVVAFAVCVAVALSGALIGCATQGTDGQSGSQSAAEPAPTYQQLIEMYPNEYGSAMTHKTDELGIDNSHAGFQVLMETPAVRDVSGAILEVVDESDPRKTDVDLKCVACKSSKFVDLYEQNGVSAFTGMIVDEDTMGVLDGQYWDCYSCHSWDGGEWSVSPNAAYADPEIFPNVADFFGSLNPKEAVCGQCHNTVSSRAYVQSEEDLETYDPYRYGYGLDERYKAMVEDGMYSVDEPTGIKLVSMNHPQIEVFQDSIHQSMGLTCVSCHMVEDVDAEGSTFTSHDASGTIAAKDNAMEYCLSCHSAQDGLETIDDMRSFLKENQDAQASRQLEVEESMSLLYDKTLVAVESGNVDDETIEKAKEAYSLAYWYVKQQQGNIIDPVDGAQIPHNPDLLRSALERADVSIQSGLELW